MLLQGLNYYFFVLLSANTTKIWKSFFSLVMERRRTNIVTMPMFLLKIHTRSPIILTKKHWVSLSAITWAAK